MFTIEELSCEELAEWMRKKDRYRQLIKSGKLVLPFVRAAQLLGQDCLYQLYSVTDRKKRRTLRSGSGARPRKPPKHPK
ncbi:MAG TPA: hypothetical protein VE398_17060 [Acidobacteriota bacterium]|nr:hypothetical protein [Acidobacteriota bacterium]